MPDVKQGGDVICKKTFKIPLEVMFKWLSSELAEKEIRDYVTDCKYAYKDRWAR